jgi:hypothetical protein
MTETLINADPTEPQMNTDKHRFLLQSKRNSSAFIRVYLRLISIFSSVLFVYLWLIKAALNLPA